MAPSAPPPRTAPPPSTSLPPHMGPTSLPNRREAPSAASPPKVAKHHRPLPRSPAACPSQIWPEHTPWQPPCLVPRRAKPFTQKKKKRADPIEDGSFLFSCSPAVFNPVSSPFVSNLSTECLLAARDWSAVVYAGQGHDEWDSPQASYSPTLP
ncbi:hypothetical protein EJB05_12764, partial [Eragrostis curvula]